MNQNENRLVSIVMPSYNHAHLLPRAINSIIAQTYTNWELIIIDNHSTDNTKEVIYSFRDSRIKLFQINNEGVVAKSRNLGIKEAKGNWIAFLDSDDWWSNNKLEISIKYLNRDFDVVYHDLYFVQDETNLTKTKLKSRILKKPAFESLLTEGNAIINSSVVVRAELLKKVGLLDEQKEIIASEDYELWLRVSLLTEKFYMIKHCLGYYLYIGGNLSKNKNLSLAGEIILEKYRSRINNNIMVKAEGYLRYIEASFYIASGNKKLAKKYFKQSFINGTLIVKAKSIYRILRLYI